jgi:hypothetical protein
MFMLYTIGRQYEYMKYAMKVVIRVEYSTTVKPWSYTYVAQRHTTTHKTWRNRTNSWVQEADPILQEPATYFYYKPA